MKSLPQPKNGTHVFQIDNARQAHALAKVEPSKRVEVLEKAAKNGPVIAIVQGLNGSDGGLIFGLEVFIAIFCK